MKLFTNKNSGFTLIEMLIAMTVFAVFVSSLAGSYLMINSAQHDTDDLRKMYSQGRAVMDELSEFLYEGTIDYSCFDADTNECGGEVDQITNTISSSSLRIVMDGGKRFTMRAVPCESGEPSCFELEKIVEVYSENMASFVPSEDDGYINSLDGGYQRIAQDNVYLKALRFQIPEPRDDKLQAPYVSIFLKFAFRKRSGEIIEYPVQTTITLRKT